MLTALTYIAAFLCLSGVVFKSIRFKKESRQLNQSSKIDADTNAVDIFSGVLNTLFQLRLFRAGKIRWLMHFLVFTGFLYLLIVHALHSYTSPYLFDYYDPTIDPFQFLRNLSGLFVLVGSVLFLLKRVVPSRINQDRGNKYKGCFSILLIVLIIVSGFMLEASKIISEPVFMEMVQEYSDLESDDGLENLKLYWQETQTVFFNTKPDYSEKRMAIGRELNEEYCTSCHSDIRSSFISRPLARVFTIKGRDLNNNRADRLFYFTHYLLCLLLLVFLPFGRMYHIFLIPFASLKRNQHVDAHLLNGVTVKAAMLNACTNCGVCSQVCSVYPNFQITRNMDILPHAKIESVKKMGSGTLDITALQQLQKGNHACTMCHKCTVVCPSGIDLQSVWRVCDDYLNDKNMITSHSFFKRLSLKAWAEMVPEVVEPNVTDQMTSDLADKQDAFENCIQCTICTNVCPVVSYGDSDNDYTPQQIMNLLRLGQKKLALGTHMVWNCLTCYACQEICPQQIRVTDILLELRHIGREQADRKILKMNKDKDE